MSAQGALLVASLAAALVAGCSGSGAAVARPSGGNVNIRLRSDWGNPIDGGATMSSGAGACSYWKQYQERLLNKHHALQLVAPQTLWFAKGFSLTAETTFLEPSSVRRKA